MIVEDHDDYLLVSDYCRPCGWHERCKPTGELYRVNRIGPGRPTKGRIDLLKTELTARSQWSQAT